MITGYQFYKRPFPYFHRKWQLVALIAMSVSVVMTIVQNFFSEQATALVFLLNTVGYTIVAAISSSFSLHITSLRDVWREESPIIYQYDVPKGTNDNL